MVTTKRRSASRKRLPEGEHGRGRALRLARLLPLAVLGLGIPGVAPAAAQDSAPADVAAAAGTLVGVVRSLPWGAGCEAWAAERGAECERFRGDGSATRSEDLWCYRAADPRTGGVAFFHLLDPGATRPACGLTEYQWRAEVEPSSPGLSAALETGLTRAYGTPERPERAEGWGSASWRDLRLYRTPQGELLLHDVVDRAGRTLRVQVRARSAGRLARLESRTGYLAHRDLLSPPSPDSLLTASLDPATPGLVLLGRSLDPESPPRQELDALGALLRRVDAGDREAPALLLLANRLVDRVAEWASRHDDDRARYGPIVRAVEDLGVRLEYSSLGGVFANPGDLLRRLWREHPGTPFGHLAFARLQASGWDTTGMCARGADAFREVVREGEAFLATYPGSPVAPTVLTTLALANETWWSLSQAGERDEYAAPAAYAQGADQARRAAIVRYRELIAGTPGPEARAYIRDHLALLELGLDTNQRVFHCVYD